MTLAEAWGIIEKITPALGVLFAWAFWSMRKEFVDRKKCAAHRQKLEADIAETEQAAARLDKVIASLPSSGSLEDLRAIVHELVTQVSVLQEAMKGQNALLVRLEGQVTRMDTYLRTVTDA